MKIFKFIYPSKPIVPIVLSVPHSGTLFPEELKKQYKKKLVGMPDDTDWFVDKLYDFAPAMGITMICSTYSRWVIDLNRSHDNSPLYTDGRRVTGLCPLFDFFGTPIYADERKEIQTKEIDRRLRVYYYPYHVALHSILTKMRKQFSNVLLWDCHSIRQFVPSISKEKFPDLILGTADATSASPKFIENTLQELHQSNYLVSHNKPFKGGHITRHYGRPSQGWQALQMEMSKINYMDDREQVYHSGRADKMRTVLQNVFDKLTIELTSKKT